MSCHTITFSVALLLSTGGFAHPQEKTTPSRASQPFLTRCTDQNPPPCADKAPVPTHTTDPEYSREAKKAKIKGTVVLTVVVGTDGLAHNISVVKPLGYGLDEEAVKALRQWRFKPGEGAGKPAPVQIQIEMEFRYP
jgi:TonB family protein